MVKSMELAINLMSPVEMATNLVMAVVESMVLGMELMLPVEMAANLVVAVVESMSLVETAAYLVLAMESTGTNSVVVVESM